MKLSDFELEEPAPIVSSPDVSTAFVFPRYPTKNFPLGEAIEVLLGFANNGENTFNITHLAASFNYPLDFSFYIQNFTTKETNVIVPPGGQVSVSYFFQPDVLLEPRDYGLVASVFYRDQEGVNWTSVFFNSTVEVAEAAGPLDTQTFFTFLAIFAILGLVGFFVYRSLNSWRKKQSYTGKVEYGTRRQLDNDWLTGTAADPALAKKKNLRKRVNKSG